MFQDLKGYIDIMWLAEQFNALSFDSRTNLLQHLADEYAGIDDEFTELVEQLLQALYAVIKLQNTEKIQQSLEERMFTNKTSAQLYSAFILIENVNLYVSEFI
jgi:hypothetical protein